MSYFVKFVGKRYLEIQRARASANVGPIQRSHRIAAVRPPWLIAAVVIPLNPEGMGIEEWVILFSENFEGMDMGIGMNNPEKLKKKIGIASWRCSLRQKITNFLGVQVSRK